MLEMGINEENGLEQNGEEIRQSDKFSIMLVCFL